MLDNREIGRTLRINDDALQVLKGKTIKDVEYTEAADGRSEVVRIALDNGFSFVIESGARSDESSHVSASIEKEQ